eukprot:scaffold183280_cov16-Tisochrysis_lutea.AAC.1
MDVSEWTSQSGPLRVSEWTSQNGHKRSPSVHPETPCPIPDACLNGMLFSCGSLLQVSPPAHCAVALGESDACCAATWQASSTRPCAS